jgi:cell division septal protein FtsQ
MDIDIQKQHTNHIKDRILRFRPIAFIKKNLPIFIVLFVFLLTMLIGIWNIKKYTLTDLQGLDIPTNVSTLIDKYMEEKLVGRNYFSFSTTSFEKDMLKSVPYIKEVNIEKVIPNKLEVFVDLYRPASTALIRDSECYLLSGEGIVLDTICKEDTVNCCKNYSTDHSLYLFTSAEVDSSTMENGKQELIIIESIYKVVKVINTYGYEIKGITFVSNILEITTKTDQSFKFSMAEDLDLQLERYISVANKVKSDNLEFKSIDFRFERPVLKN